MLRRTRSLIGSLMLVTFASAAVFVSSAAAQQGTAVRGTVTDATGAVVANATVKLINDEKGFSRASTTSSSGAYSFASVPPDTYRIEIEASGFKKLIVSNVAALVDKPTEANAILEAGNINEVVNVAGGDLASIVNTQDASLGNNFVSKQIQELPLEGRQVANLLSLQPGVTQTGEVTGSRSDQGNITLDGVDVNDQQNGTAFEPVIRVTPDSVDEFRVTTTNADASRGRSSGAQISLSTKSGTNEFRGALYEYHRNTKTSANDFFNNLNGVARPKLIRNLFGGRLGGPVVKDRFFFFYNFEAMRESRETPVTNLVPLASLGQGTVKFVDDTGVVRTLTTADINNLQDDFGDDVVNVNPAATAVLAAAAARYPANDFTVGDGLNTAGFRFNAKVPAKENAHTGRIDWKLTRDERHSLSFRTTLQGDTYHEASQFPDTPSTVRRSTPMNLSTGHTWVINNNLVNNFRWGYTRQHFKESGDTGSADTITFRGVFSPLGFDYPFERDTKVHNFVNDVSWIRGSHSFQFGGNIRTVRNHRSDETAQHDIATVNRSYFAASGAVLTDPIMASTPYVVDDSFILNARDAMAAVLGRFSEFHLGTNFGKDGKPLAKGIPIIRDFATEEYDVYLQDSWRVTQNLNLTYGLRYGLSRPVYEKNGYQTAPNIGLQEYLDRRIAAAANGTNYGDAPGEELIVDLAGPANGKGHVYPWDKNNFQPSIAVAWSPNFKNGFLRRLFGTNNASVFRGGFRITNDYFGQALAVNFDANNTLGFASTTDISANTYDVTSFPGPQFTGFNQTIRNLTLPPGLSLPTSLVFPLKQPLDGQRRIEGSLDTNLVSPINYQWNFTYGREFAKGIYLEASYIGRLGRNLLAARDIMQPNNIKDPKSGQTWYQAAQALDAHRRAGTPINSVPNQPFFENMFPAGAIDDLLFGAGLSNTRAAYGFMARTSQTAGCAGAPLFGCYGIGNDWTYLQDVLDIYMPAFYGGNVNFYNQQYGALSAYGTIGSSDYHGMTFSVRQRFKGISWDANYTFSKSLDDASGVQTSDVFDAAFIHNALRQSDNRSVSDFDVRHVFNMNSIFELPFGKGRRFLSGAGKFVNGLLGGWQLSSIFRMNSGYPITDGMVDIAGWPTNWNVRSFVVRTGPVTTSPTKNGPGGVPNLFSDPTAAYKSFRNAAPGETGDRNLLRYPGYIALDLGLAKSFDVPWHEGHKIQIRGEGFNITNTQRLTAADTIFGLDPFRGSPQSTFGKFTEIQGSPRVFQFAIRYDF